MGRLASGQHHQESPQVVAVVQAREAALLGAADEGIEGGQGDVLLVGGAAGGGAERGAGAGDELAEVALPQVLRGGAVAGLEQVDPAGDGAFGRHGPGLALGGLDGVILSGRRGPVSRVSEVSTR